MRSRVVIVALLASCIDIAGASCRMAGTWHSPITGARIRIDKGLSGTLKLLYCQQAHALTVARSASGRFDVHASYVGDDDCIGFDESIALEASCRKAIGTYANRLPGREHGLATWVRGSDKGGDRRARRDSRAGRAPERRPDVE